MRLMHERSSKSLAQLWFENRRLSNFSQPITAVAQALAATQAPACRNHGNKWLEGINAQTSTNIRHIIKDNKEMRYI